MLQSELIRGGNDQNKEVYLPRWKVEFRIRFETVFPFNSYISYWNVFNLSHYL